MMLLAVLITYLCRKSKGSLGDFQKWNKEEFGFWKVRKEKKKELLAELVTVYQNAELCGFVKKKNAGGTWRWSWKRLPKQKRLHGTKSLDVFG